MLNLYMIYFPQGDVVSFCAETVANSSLLPPSETRTKDIIQYRTITSLEYMLSSYTKIQLKKNFGSNYLVTV